MMQCNVGQRVFLYVPGNGEIGVNAKQSRVSSLINNVDMFQTNQPIGPLLPSTIHPIPSLPSHPSHPIYPIASFLFFSLFPLSLSLHSLPPHLRLTKMRGLTGEDKGRWRKSKKRGFFNPSSLGRCIVELFVCLSVRLFVCSSRMV